MLQSDYDFYNDQYEEVKRIDYVGKDSKYENKNNDNKKKSKRAFRFKKTNRVQYNNKNKKRKHSMKPKILVKSK